MFGWFKKKDEAYTPDQVASLNEGVKTAFPDLFAAQVAEAQKFLKTQYFISEASDEAYIFRCDEEIWSVSPNGRKMILDSLPEKCKEVDYESAFATLMIIRPDTEYVTFTGTIFGPLLWSDQWWVCPQTGLRWDSHGASEQDQSKDLVDEAPDRTCPRRSVVFVRNNDPWDEVLVYEYDGFFVIHHNTGRLQVVKSMPVLFHLSERHLEVSFEKYAAKKVRALTDPLGRNTKPIESLDEELRIVQLMLNEPCARCERRNYDRLIDG